MSLMSTPDPHKWEFFRFLLEVEALRFGSFELKSGRVSPYFFNSARFQTGFQLARLGRFLAAAIRSAAPAATIIYGPAYKGIPLCVAAAQALAHDGGGDVGWLFNRKEPKGHGDQGRFVGKIPTGSDRIVIVDDVITDGETKKEAVELLRGNFEAPIEALVIAFDRMEQGAEGGAGASAGFEQSTGIPVHAIFTLADLEEALQKAGSEVAELGLPPTLAREISSYRAKYGIQPG